MEGGSGQRGSGRGGGGGLSFNFLRGTNMLTKTGQQAMSNSKAM